MGKRKPQYSAITKKILTDEYLIKNHTIQYICEKYKLSKTHLYRYLRKFEIEKKRNLVGRQFKRLVVLKKITSDIGGVHESIWECKCECGQIVNIKGRSLLRHRAKSCGHCNLEPKSKFAWHGHGDISGSYWSHVKKLAYKRKIPVSITIEYAWDLFNQQNQKCALTGQLLHFSRRYFSKSQTASLDRIDSKKGYTQDNVQWVHKDINKLKLATNNERFIELCKLVAKHHT